MGPHKHSFYILKLFLCIICLVFFVPAKTTLGAYDSDDYFVIANDLLNKGMYLEALSIYEEITTYADNINNRARAMLFMGTTYSLYLDQYDAASQQFEKVIKLFPDSPSASEALFNAGMVYYEKNEFKRAYEIFSYYLTKYPKGIRRQSAEVWASGSKEQITSSRKETIFPHKLRITNTIIRVLIKKDATKIAVNSKQMIVIDIPFSRKRIYHGRGPLAIAKHGKYIAINGRAVKADTCRVVSEGTLIMLDGHSYRGFFMVSSGNRGLGVINYLPVEKYLYGVVPKEMSYKWNKEALKAQAVAARTYALYVKAKSKDKPYDVEATTASQVYGGYAAERVVSNSAVDLTQGQVMTYNGNLIIAYFHANSGGHTEDAKNVWRADMPYLKGVPDRFSRGSSGGAWEYFLSFNSLKDQLNRYGFNIKWIKSIKQSGISMSGRSILLNVVSDKGTFAFSSNNFRIKVGATKLKSTLFQIKPYRNGMLITGNGYGHGVGMSQRGAERMARAGYSYNQILRHYYRGIKIMEIGR